MHALHRQEVQEVKPVRDWRTREGELGAATEANRVNLIWALFVQLRLSRCKRM